MAILSHITTSGVRSKVRPPDTVATAMLGCTSETDNDEGEEFFDIEFAVPSENHRRGSGDGEDDTSSSSDDDAVREFGCGPRASFSNSGDLFFRGRVLPVGYPAWEPTGKCHIPSFSKSAARFQVLMLRLKKSKPVSPEIKVAAGGNVTTCEQPVPELARDDSHSSDKKSSNKDIVKKYFSKIKPFYVRASKRYSEKLRFSGHLSSGDGSIGQKSPHGGGLRAVGSRLRKSRSASASVAAIRPPAVAVYRQDNLLAEDGIESAIDHCKRSFNSFS